MSNKSKVLALSGLVLSALSFGGFAADQNAPVTAQKAASQTRVVSFKTLTGLQALNYNLARRHIDLSDRSLIADEKPKVEDNGETVQANAQQDADAVD
jgi:hypothetical protein